MMGLCQFNTMTWTLLLMLVTNSVVWCTPVRLHLDPLDDSESSHYENYDATRLAPTRQKRQSGLNNYNPSSYYYNPANFFNRGLGTFNYPGSFFPNTNNFPNTNQNNNNGGGGTTGNPAYPYGWNGGIPQNNYYGFPSWTTPTFPSSAPTNPRQPQQPGPPSSTLNNGQVPPQPLNTNQSPNQVPVLPVNNNNYNNYGNTQNQPLPPSPQQQNQQQQIGGARPGGGGLSPTGQAINPGNNVGPDGTYPHINSNHATPQAPYPTNNINSNPNNGIYKPQPPSGGGLGGNPQLYQQPQQQQPQQQQPLQQPGGNSGTVPENSGNSRSPPSPDGAGDIKNLQNSGAGNSGDQLPSNPSPGDWRDASNVVPVNAGKGGGGGKDDTSSIDLDGIGDEYLP